MDRVGEIIHYYAIVCVMRPRIMESLSEFNDANQFPHPVQRVSFPPPGFDPWCRICERRPVETSELGSGQSAPR